MIDNRIKHVFIFENGMVAVTDDSTQIPEYQGRWEEVCDRLLKALPVKTDIKCAYPPALDKIFVHGLRRHLEGDRMTTDILATIRNRFGTEDEVGSSEYREIMEALENAESGDEALSILNEFQEWAAKISGELAADFDGGPSQIGLVSGICMTLARHGVKDADPRIIGACIKAADLILAELNREPVMASSGMGLAAWLKSDDTGMSSRFMAYVLASGPFVHTPDYPLDPSDFGRCHRFLEAVPEARKNLAKLSKHHPVWAEYVKRWDELTQLYLEELPSGSAPRLYAIMESIQMAASKPGTPAK